MKKIFKYISIALTFIFFTFNLFASQNESLKIGSDEAKITVKVFSSLTCPHCATFHKNIFEKLKKEYIDKNKVKFEHHSFPLDLAALNAEKVLRCANSPEISFNLLKTIYEEQDKWAIGSDINKINELLVKIGLDFGLSENKIKNCLNNESVQEKILNERIEAQKKFKITSTPTIYLNEKKYEGKHEYELFKKQIEKLL
jgi:protein-disulfide isomerase|tara:strand:+ start:1462 stop:2058 length:597 start_codon:yes stop_codon:yes gene_type:complete